MNDEKNEESKLQKTNSNKPVTDTTQTITVEATSKAAAPINKQFLELEKTTKTLLEKLLAKLKSLKLEGNGQLQKEKQEQLLAYLEKQLEEIDQLRKELNSEKLSDTEKNKSNFLDVCIREFNKIVTEGSLGDLKDLQHNLSKLNDKLVTNTYPQLSQNKDDPNFYSVSHVSKEQLQEAGKAVCANMKIPYEENDNGFKTTISTDKLHEFQALVMQKLYEKSFTSKQEEQSMKNRGEDVKPSITAKR